MFGRFLDTQAGARRMIEASGLFDAAWYADRYPEAGSAGMALAHFLKVGAEAGNDPGPGFSVRGYLADHPDVAASGMNPLLHYLRFGRGEGRTVRDGQGRPGGAVDPALGGVALARVRAAFDDAFYAATNPDLPEGTDGFAHYMGPGWRQRRDPASWFSTDHYLKSHGDVAAGGSNPFVHYVLEGCREGRGIAPSTRRRHGAVERAERPRLAALAMVKNEGDIIRAFAGHVLALFDEVVIVDHMSQDGTAEFLADLAAGHAQVTLIRLEEPSYIQSVAMTHLVRTLDCLATADWVFPLDADEFLPFPDRAALIAALSPFARCPVISMRWRNLIPARYWDGEVSLGREAEFLVPPRLSDFRKVAFQPSRLPLARAVVAQGNHAVLETANGLEIPAFDADFPILHLPVRSAGQIRLKLEQGVRAYRRMGGRRDAGQGTHWDEMRAAIGSGLPGRAVLNAMAVGYSEPKPGLEPMEDAALEAAGYRRERFMFAALKDDALPCFEALGLADALMRLDAGADEGGTAEDCPSATRLVLGDGCLRRADTAEEYPRLDDRMAEEGEVSLTEALSRLFRGGYREVADLMPGDWSGHVPFMLALPALARPRRFVEIGTLWGTSFLAFAQGASEAGLDCPAVAISSWAVEEARAAEFANVWETFRFVASKYADRTAMLRMGTDAALHRFEDGSIDLLHLDGLADYDAARRLLEDWRPKLSARGVVLIHDIHAHGPGFGVWRLWDDLKTSLPTLEFRHDGGLGLACIGTRPPPALLTLARAFAADPGLRTMLQEHFERMGRLSAELFSRRYDMAQAEMRAAAEGAVTEEASWLRQELEALRSEADGLRELVRRGGRDVRAG